MAKGKHEKTGKSDKRKIERTKSNRTKINKTKSTKKRIVLLLLILIFIISVSITAFFVYNKYKNKNENDELKEIFSNVEETKPNERIEKVKELQKENSDIIGWLEIPNSNISYPVLQCEDNEYYMTHNYKKEYSKDGSLFLDKDYDWSIPSTNLLIYGHNNIGSTEMFKGLEEYNKEDYYKYHKTIRLTTDKEDAEYEILSVFLSRVYYKSETNVFRYYYFINAENEEEFNNYVNEAKKASLYDTGVTAEYGDQLLTLTTCSYHTTDGRLAVVARKVENN